LARTFQALAMTYEAGPRVRKLSGYSDLVLRLK
jgi:hypothetical protein